MQFSGSTEFAADRNHVWGHLIDPTRLGPCSPIPIERVDERHFRLTTRVGSGFFATTVRADLEVTEVVDGERASIAGVAGASGTKVDARSSFQIRDGAPGRTVVDWQLNLEPSGMFASTITRAIQEHAQETIDRVIACLHGQIEG